MRYFYRLGTWKITANYDDDEENIASREFRVQQFGELNPLDMCMMFCVQTCDSDSAFL